MRASRPKAMKFLKKDALIHSNLKTDLTEKRVLNITGKIFVRKFSVMRK